MPPHPAAAETPGAEAAPFRPAPGAKPWDVRAVEAIMAERAPAVPHEAADGWHAVPWDQGVAVQRIMGGHYLRPSRAGRARDEWDELIRGDREHLRARGLQIVNPGSSQTYVRVPVPSEPQSVARLRRVGSPEEFRRSVSFDGWPEIGGTLRFLATHASARYEAADHAGGAVWVGDSDAAGAVKCLARHYGLPFPVAVVDEGARDRSSLPAS
ncbi:hypothetical protein [Streptomyces sp. NRRL B-24484]|uniref:hypothetical protein n=1 Tax=Streptomyces sp. NRRL B-24484 TaxID=1463833 RepID=UPI0004BEFA75|nr:hypothetical protein [Streptomyces sp. NRRL B-24484]